MANEIGFWQGGGGANGAVLSGSVANIAAGLHTAGSGETITHVRCFRNAGGTGTTTLRIGLFVTSAGSIANGASPVQSVTFSTSVGSAAEFGADVSWALTNGVVYALALSSDDGGIFNLSTAARTNGAQDSNNIVSSTWSDAGTENLAYEIAGDISGVAVPNPPFPWQSQGAMGVMVAM